MTKEMKEKNKKAKDMDGKKNKEKKKECLLEKNLLGH
jgi:hypothetical protein